MWSNGTKQEKLHGVVIQRQDYPQGDSPQSRRATLWRSGNQKPGRERAKTETDIKQGHLQRQSKQVRKMQGQKQEIRLKQPFTACWDLNTGEKRCVCECVCVIGWCQGDTQSQVCLIVLIGPVGHVRYPVSNYLNTDMIHSERSRKQQCQLVNSDCFLLVADFGFTSLKL